MIKRKPKAVKSDHLDELAALFDLGPYDRNQLTRADIDHLRNRIDSEGLAPVAKELEISEIALLRACAGFGHRLMVRTAAKIRAYFQES
ncbi:MAG TPA: hypothetical protein VGI70_18225 [Polyangiales bacterium]